ncbi:MAG: glycosyltransferase family 4 protein [Elusimicrobiota bacterium]
MKILFVVPLPPPWAGVEQISRIIIESQFPPHWQTFVLKSNIRDSNAKKGQWDLKGILKVLSLGFRLFYLCLFKKINVVYVTLSQNSSGLMRDLFYVTIIKFLHIKVVAHLHGSRLNHYLDTLPCLFRQVVIFLIGKINLIIVCSDGIKADIHRFYSGMVERVYNGYPLIGSREVFHKSAHDVHVSFMGHLSVAKGFYDLVHVSELLLKRYPNVHFHFAGERLDDEKNIDVENKAKSDWSLVDKLLREYSDRFVLHGIISGKEKEKFFSNSDIFVLPSYSEAFPVAVLEGLSYGLPLVVTRVGALPEVLIEGKNALFIDFDNSSHLTSAIELLIQNAD